jgi:hypothetical protein
VPIYLFYYPKGWGVLLFGVSAKSKKNKSSAHSAALRWINIYKNPFEVTIMPMLLGMDIDLIEFIPEKDIDVSMALTVACIVFRSYLNTIFWSILGVGASF